MSPIILAIESSCDETSASVIRNGKVLNNIIATQVIHRKYGGVVPELASRAHQQNIVATVHEAIDKFRYCQNRFKCHCVHAWPGTDGIASRWGFLCKRPVIGIEYSADRGQSHAGTCAGSFYRRPQTFVSILMPHRKWRPYTNRAGKGLPGHGSDRPNTGRCSGGGV